MALEFTNRMYVHAIPGRHLKLTQKDYGLLADSILFCGGQVDPTPSLTELCHCPSCEGKIFCTIEQLPTDTAMPMLYLRAMPTKWVLAEKLPGSILMHREEFMRDVTPLEDFTLKPLGANDVIVLHSVAQLRSLMIMARRQSWVIDKGYKHHIEEQRLVSIYRDTSLKFTGYVLRFESKGVIDQYKGTTKAYNLISFSAYRGLCTQPWSCFSGSVPVIQRLKCGTWEIKTEVDYDPEAYINGTKVLKEDFRRRFLEVINGQNGRTVFIHQPRGHDKTTIAKDVLKAIDKHLTVQPFSINIDSMSWMFTKETVQYRGTSYANGGLALRAFIEDTLKKKYSHTTAKLVGEVAFRDNGATVAVHGYFSYDKTREYIEAVGKAMQAMSKANNVAMQAHEDCKKALEAKRIDEGRRTEEEVEAALISGQIVRCKSDNKYYCISGYDTPWVFESKTNQVIDLDECEDSMGLRAWLNKYVGNKDERFTFHNREEYE